MYLLFVTICFSIKVFNIYILIIYLFLCSKKCLQNNNFISVLEQFKGSTHNNKLFVKYNILLPIQLCIGTIFTLIYYRIHYYLQFFSR